MAKKTSMLVALIALTGLLFLIGCLNEEQSGAGFASSLVTNEAVDSDELEASNRAYAEGIAALSKKNYYKAIELLEKVSLEDKNYKEANEYLKKAREGLALELVEKGKTKMAAAEYETALKYFKEAASLDSGLTEAKEMLKRAEEKLFASQVQDIRKEMASFEGEGDVAFAVNKLEARGAAGGYVYLHVQLKVKNQGNKIVRLVPNNFSVTGLDGQSVSIHYDTYDLPDYLRPVDLQPGEQTGGWVIFHIAGGSVYTINYHGLAETASKRIAP